MKMQESSLGALINGFEECSEKSEEEKRFAMADELASVPTVPNAREDCSLSVSGLILSTTIDLNLDQIIWRARTHPRFRKRRTTIADFRILKTLYAIPENPHEAEERFAIPESLKDQHFLPPYCPPTFGIAALRRHSFNDVSVRQQENGFLSKRFNRIDYDAKASIESMAQSLNNKHLHPLLHQQLQDAEKQLAKDGAAPQSKDSKTAERLNGYTDGQRGICRRKADESDVYSLRAAVSTYVLSYDTGANENDEILRKLSNASDTAEDLSLADSSLSEVSSSDDSPRASLCQLLKQLEPLRPSTQRRGSFLVEEMEERMATLPPISEGSKTGIMTSVASGSTVQVLLPEGAPNTILKSGVDKELEHGEEEIHNERATSGNNSENSKGEDVLNKLLSSPKLSSTKRGSLGELLRNLAASPTPQSGKRDQAISDQKCKNLPDYGDSASYYTEMNSDKPESSKEKSRVLGQDHHVSQQLESTLVNKTISSPKVLEQQGSLSPIPQMNAISAASAGEASHSIIPENGGSTNSLEELQSHPTPQASSSYLTARDGNHADMFNKILDSSLLLRRRGSLREVLRTLSPIPTQQGKADGTEEESKPHNRGQNSDSSQKEASHNPQSNVQSSKKPEPSVVGSKELLAAVHQRVMTHSPEPQRRCQRNFVFSENLRNESPEESLRNAVDLTSDDRILPLQNCDETLSVSNVVNISGIGRDRSNTKERGDPNAYEVGKDVSSEDYNKYSKKGDQSIPRSPTPVKFTKASNQDDNQPQGHSVVNRAMSVDSSNQEAKADAPKRKISVHVMRRSPVIFSVSSNEKGGKERADPQIAVMTTDREGVANPKRSGRGAREVQPTVSVSPQIRSAFGPGKPDVSQIGTVDEGALKSSPYKDASPTGKRFAALSEKYASLQAKFAQGFGKEKKEKEKEKGSDGRDDSTSAKDNREERSDRNSKGCNGGDSSIINNNNNNNSNSNNNESGIFCVRNIKIDSNNKDENVNSNNENNNTNNNNKEWRNSDRSSKSDNEDDTHNNNSSNNNNNNNINNKDQRSGDGSSKSNNNQGNNVNNNNNNNNNKDTDYCNHERQSPPQDSSSSTSTGQRPHLEKVWTTVETLIVSPITAKKNEDSPTEKTASEKNKTRVSAEDNRDIPIRKRTSVLAKLMDRKLGRRRKQSIVPKAVHRKSKVYQIAEGGATQIPTSMSEFEAIRSGVEKKMLIGPLCSEVRGAKV